MKWSRPSDNTGEQKIRRQHMHVHSFSPHSSHDASKLPKSLCVRCCSSSDRGQVDSGWRILSERSRRRHQLFSSPAPSLSLPPAAAAATRNNRECRCSRLADRRRLDSRLSTVFNNNNIQGKDKVLTILASIPLRQFYSNITSP